MTHRRIPGVIALAAGLVGSSAAAAPATPPGTNGQIAWQLEPQDPPPQRWVANPDGSRAREVFLDPTQRTSRRPSRP